MAEFPHLTAVLPGLDRTGDPRGGAAVWALLAVVAAVVAGILLVTF